MLPLNFCREDSGAKWTVYVGAKREVSQEDALVEAFKACACRKRGIFARKPNSKTMKIPQEILKMDALSFFLTFNVSFFVPNEVG